MRAPLALAALIASVGLIATAEAERSRPSGAAQPAPARFSALLRDTLKTNGVIKHLQALQDIADDNGGNRSAGLPGYRKSVAYVAKALKGYGWNVEREKFAFDAFFQDEPAIFARTSPNPRAFSEDTEFTTMDYAGSGDVTAGLVAVDLTLPPSPVPTSTSGCEAADFTGLDVAGKVALMQRGGCDYAVKVANAAAAGAAAAVIFNEGQVGRTDVVSGTLGSAAPIPAVFTGFAIGSELANGILNGPTGTTGRVKTVTRIERLTAKNVIADLPGGDRKHVVMAGAHLDSVVDGPGINDNGSGSAALLEIARRLSESGVEPTNRIRFAWWGAEEEGLIGSTDYVEGLKKKALQKIALYLNFDMIGSLNFIPLTYDGDGDVFGVAGPEGSGKIEQTFEKYFSKQGVDAGPTPFDGRSDYLAFIDSGIPAGGLFTGELDPCYHQACDDIDNVSRRALRLMVPAVADSVARYAIDLGPITSQGKGGKGKRAAASSSSDYLGDKLRR